MTGTDAASFSHLQPAVPPDLLPHLVRWAGFHDLHAAPFTHLMPATLFLPLIINFSDPYHIHAGHRPDASAAHDTFVAGLIDRFTVVRSVGPVHCLQIDFTPFGARAFFQMPLNEIAGQVVDLQDLMGPAGRDLIEQLALSRNWSDRFDLLGSFVRSRIATGPRPSTAVRHAMQQIIRSAGQARVGPLADSLEISREHLSRCFAADVGIGPKAFARIIRFQQAESRLRQRRASAAQIAHDTGYADQAHMGREFRRMSGLAPGDL